LSKSIIFIFKELDYKFKHQNGTSIVKDSLFGEAFISNKKVMMNDLFYNSQLIYLMEGNTGW
jgi:hypothetical protein